MTATGPPSSPGKALSGAVTGVTVVASGFDRKEVLLKLSKWFLFEVLFALIPFAFAWFGALLHRVDHNAGVLFGRGELLLVTCAIVAASVGDLVNKGMNPAMRGFKQALVGVGMLLIAASTWLYAEAATLPGESRVIDIGMVVTMSFVLALVAIAVSMACLIVAEVR